MSYLANSGMMEKNMETAIIGLYGYFGGPGKPKTILYLQLCNNDPSLSS